MVSRICAVIALIFGVTACTQSPTAPSIGCVIEGAVGGVAAIAIADKLQCTNQGAIAASIAAAASKAGICVSAPAAAIGKLKSPPKPGGPGEPLKSVGSDICNVVASTLVSSLAPGVVPKEWGCSLADATASIQGLVAAACAKTFP